MKFKDFAVAAGVTTGISVLAYKKISDDMFRSIFSRRDKQDIVDQKYLDWISSSAVDQVSVNSFDGLKLNAYDIHNNDTDKYIIMVHGIWSSKAFLYERAFHYDSLGYNLLMIDQRSAGDSEGENYTYGQKEALDLTVWINYLVEKKNDVKICLYGHSMGAATVMIATAYDLPDNVKCIVEESGFSSMKEEMDHILRKNYKISYTGISLMMIELRMKKEFGVSFDDIAPKTCLENNEIPILFVHGEKDDFVPFEMSKILYNHNKGIRKIYPVPDAGHVDSDQNPDYYKNINSFIETYMI